MDNYEFAKRFASIMPCSQKYGDLPYTYHLEQVDATLCSFGFEDDMNLRTAAWLHDVVEDTEITYKHIKSGFGEAIADLVSVVTNEPGKNRKERNEKTYQKIKLNQSALILKLADRIANVVQSSNHNDGLFKMYKKEYSEFKNTLYKKSNDFRIEKMWSFLEKQLGIGEKNE